MASPLPISSRWHLICCLEIGVLFVPPPFGWFNDHQWGLSYDVMQNAWFFETIPCIYRKQLFILNFLYGLAFRGFSYDFLYSFAASLLWKSHACPRLLLPARWHRTQGGPGSGRTVHIHWPAQRCPKTVQLTARWRRKWYNVREKPNKLRIWKHFESTHFIKLNDVKSSVVYCIHFVIQYILLCSFLGPTSSLKHGRQSSCDWQ